MQKSSYYIVLVIFLLTGAVIFTHTSEDTSSSLKSYMASQNIEIEGAGNYTIQKRSVKDLSGFKVQEVSAFSENSILELRVISGVSSAFARKYLEQKHTKISSIYSNTPAPYGAIPDRQADCKTENKLNFTINSRKNNNYSVYEVLTDEHKNYACSRAEAEYKKRILLIYCTQEEVLIESESYIPLNSSSKHQINLSCTS